MKLSLTLLAASVAAAHADSESSASRWASLRRRLSFDKVAGYEPGSQVTDHCAIDLDQKAIEDQLLLKTPEAFANAKKIYNNGGNSKSYAIVTVEAGLSDNVSKGDQILGKNAEGGEVSGKAYAAASAGDKTIMVQYTTSDKQASYVECQVGSLMEPNMKGCLAATGTITIDGKAQTYEYDPATQNNNGRTIAKFSTGAKELMLDCAKGCPYNDYKAFYDYYGMDDYANEWVEAAFEGRKTQFTRGDADFTKFGMDGREQAIKKGTAYMNIFMYVIREFEDALDDCESQCINCNEGSVHAWDEGVCFYTGSIEGEDGLTDDGKLLHQLGDKRCGNFKTCGEEGTNLDGTAKVNHQLFDLFAVGNDQLKRGECESARKTTQKVKELMYIPMIQGTLRYAYKVSKLQGGEVEKAEGATFAAAVLPMVHAASSSAASTIHDNMKVGATSTDFKAVKSAFESVYSKMGLTCADIGGLWFEGENKYYPGMEPCGGVGASAESANSSFRLGLSAISSLCISALMYFSL